MKLNKMKIFRTLTVYVSVILSIIALAFFIKAINCASSTTNDMEAPEKVHVYINENDSTVNQLQQDVSRLTKLIEEFQSDTIVVLHGKMTHQIDDQY